MDPFLFVAVFTFAPIILVILKFINEYFPLKSIAIVIYYKFHDILLRISNFKFLRQHGFYEHFIRYVTVNTRQKLQALPDVLTPDEFSRCVPPGVLSEFMDHLYVQKNDGKLHLRNLQTVTPNSLRFVSLLLGFIGMDRRLLGQEILANMKTLGISGVFLLTMILALYMNGTLMYPLLCIPLAWWIFDAVLIFFGRYTLKKVFVLNKEFLECCQRAAFLVGSQKTNMDTGGLKHLAVSILQQGGYWEDPPGPDLYQKNLPVLPVDEIEIKPSELNQIPINQNDNQTLLFLRVYGSENSKNLHTSIIDLWKKLIGPVVLIMDSVSGGSELFQGDDQSPYASQLPRAYNVAAFKAFAQGLLVPLIVLAVHAVFLFSILLTGTISITDRLKGFIFLIFVPMLLWLIYSAIAYGGIRKSILNQAASSVFINNIHEINYQLTIPDNLVTVRNSKTENHVLGLYCENSIWKYALQSLGSNADSVLMDLRGYCRTNKGCAYELGWLHAHFPLSRVLLLTDKKTDLDFLMHSISAARKHAASINPGKNDFHDLRLIRFGMAQPGDDEEAVKERSMLVCKLLTNKTKRFIAKPRTLEIPEKAIKGEDHMQRAVVQGIVKLVTVLTLSFLSIALLFTAITVQQENDDLYWAAVDAGQVSLNYLNIGEDKSWIAIDSQNRIIGIDNISNQFSLIRELPEGKIKAIHFGNNHTVLAAYANGIIISSQTIAGSSLSVSNSGLSEITSIGSLDKLKVLLIGQFPGESKNCRAVVYDLLAQSTLATWKVKTDTSAAISADRTWFIIAGEDGCLRKISAGDYSIIEEYPLSIAPQDWAGIDTSQISFCGSLCLSPDERHLYAIGGTNDGIEIMIRLGLDDETYEFYNPVDERRKLNKPHIIAVFPGSPQTNPSGAYVIRSMNYGYGMAEWENSEKRVYYLSPGEMQRTILPFKDIITSSAFHADELVLGTKEGNIRRYDLATNHLLPSLEIGRELWSRTRKQ